jgi:ribonucleoside-diphosphate reductase alpha chain
VDPEEVVRELRGISGPSPIWENGELILSTPDAIGKALERYLARRDGREEVGGGEDTSAASGGEESMRMRATCPECGSTVVHESNCLLCRNCGWSKC